MNADVKERWVAALRSGKYRKTTHKLRRENEFCVMGVLCDLHAEEHGRHWDYGAGVNNCDVYLNQGGTLPIQVVEWAGLDGPDPTLPNGYSLMSLNDCSGATFNQLADRIEQEL